MRLCAARSKPERANCLMTPEMWITLSILAAAIVLFVSEWLRLDVTALLVVAALMLTGLLTPQEALSGFSNTAVLTIASLFIVGGGVMQTGLANQIGENILRVAGSHAPRLTAVIMLAVATLSGFMSSTGTVAILLPAIISLSRKTRINPSRLLMPLAFGSLLGGSATLIGTPPNIIVADLLREAGQPTFHFFSYTPMGLVLIVAGVAYMLLVGQRLLPNEPMYTDIQRVSTPRELAVLYQLPENLFRLRVRRGSLLVDRSLAETNLRQSFNVNVLEIQRPPEYRSVMRLGSNRLLLQPEAVQKFTPLPQTLFQVDDILIVQGDSDDVRHLAAILDLGVQPAGTEDARVLSSEEVGLAEILLPPRSGLIGKTLVDAQFGRLYRLTVLGIRRPGSVARLDLKTTPLRFGDVLLVQGPWRNIIELRNQRRDLVVMGQPEEMMGAPGRKKAPLAMLILGAMLVAMVFNVLPLVTISLLAALAMILSGCLMIDDAYNALDLKSIVLIAGMLPMSIALEKVGVINLAAQGLTQTLGNWGPVWVLAGLLTLTTLFTQVLSNTATTVLIAPIGLAAAAKLGVQPQAFLMGVAIAASLGMATPVASPVNTLVMGSGNYRFSDFFKVGGPLILFLLALSMLVLPLLWPFI